MNSNPLFMGCVLYYYFITRNSFGQAPFSEQDALLSGCRPAGWAGGYSFSGTAFFRTFGCTAESGFFVVASRRLASSMWV